MNSSIKHVAVILAAGSGSRTGFSQAKQLVRLAGRPVVAHTIECFQRHPLIDEIAIVTSTDCMTEIEALVARDGANKVKKILLGGAQRYDSSLAAIRAYEAESASVDVRLIFHDAVRPLLTERIISDVVHALGHYRAVDVVIPAADTVVVADLESETIKAIPDRREMRLGQTPQAFALSVIKRAYELALQDANFRTTDDCGVVLKYLPDEKIFLVRGEATNLKLTYENDLLLLDKLIQCNSGRRLVPTDEAKKLAQLKDRNLVIFGGTSGIGAAMARLAKERGARVEIASRSTGLDIADGDKVADFLQQVAEKLGHIDGIVNTAAILNKQPLNHMTSAEVTESIQTNFTGAVNVARSGYDHLKKTSGHYLMFTSSSYTYGRAYYSIYSATKAAVVNLMQALADEWAEAGIKVNCVNPARTQTPMRTKAFGTEPEGTLLNVDTVALKALSALLDSNTGHIYDIVSD